MSKQSDGVRFGIRPKLFFVVLIGFGLLIAITVWRIGVEANKVALSSVDRSLEQSSVILNTQMNSRYRSILETVLSLTKDGRILPLVYDGDAPTLQDLTSEFKKALAFDILMITDGDGEILARSDRPEAVGQSVAGTSPLFDSALHGKQEQGIFASQGKLLQIVAAPIFDNLATDVVRGSVALAYELSPEIAQEINKLTESEISFFIFERDKTGKIIAVKNTYSTKADLNKSLDDYFAKNTQLWEALYNAQVAQKDLLINLNGEEFHAVIQPLARNGGGNLGFVMALRSQTELLKPFLKIQQQVLLVGLLCLFIAGVIAWFIAHGISRPIINLIGVTKKIEEGNYPDSKDYQRSNDEVGVLYDALFRMGKSIKDKAELENYLAQLAEDIDESELLNTESETEALKDESLYNDTDLSRDKVALKDAAGEATISGVEKEEQNADSVVDQNEATIALSMTSAMDKKNQQLHAGDKISVGQVIAERYQIIRLLGTGAMGQVYMAKDLDLGETIALKMLNQQNFSPEIIQLFKDEIRLARRITHRNILRTFDFGIWQGFYFITMEFVHGYDLSDLIDKKGPLEINIGVVMARQFCSAINAAHEQGIIHRDLKPSNMMINKQGILKIMDFGLAMQVQNRKSDSVDKGSNANTTTIAGTPKYMAPEQFVAGELDERTDIYAVGIILFTIFTGHAPFRARDFEELAMQHIKEEPPLLRSELPNAPEALEKIISKALMKNKEDRYSSIKEVIDDLQAI